MSEHEVFASALRLPKAERATIAQQLLESLDATTEIDQAWIDEALRRSDAIRAGVARTVPATLAIEMVRKAIAS